SLSTLTNFLKGRWQMFARVFSSAFAAGITTFLCLAAVQLVKAEREGGKLLAHGIPVWTIQLIMPAGFGIIALRLLLYAGGTLLGQFRGGPAIVTVLACAFFTSFTGASGVTILALGGLLLPVLLGAGYSERASLGMLTGSGGLGLLFPPSLPLILYAIVASSN